MKINIFKKIQCNKYFIYFREKSAHHKHLHTLLVPHGIPYSTFTLICAGNIHHIYANIHALRHIRMRTRRKYAFVYFLYYVPLTYVKIY